MNRYLLLCLSFLIASSMGLLAEDNGYTWRLTLDGQRYEGDYQPVFPFTLQNGESVDTGGDVDGYLGGFTISMDYQGDYLINGIDLSILGGQVDGEATYSGTFEGSTDVESDIMQLQLRLRHHLDGMLDDHLHPYLFLGLAYHDTRTKEFGTIAYTPIALDLPIHRRVDSETYLLQPGVGATLDTLLGRVTVGLRAEATIQVGLHKVDTTEGGSADDGTVAGYRLLTAGFAKVPLSDYWSLYGQAGVIYQDWFEDYDELQPYWAPFLSVGVEYKF